MLTMSLTIRMPMTIMMVGLSLRLKLESSANASSIVNVWKVKAFFSSASSSSALVGMSMMPPKVVRWLVRHATLLPSAESVVLTPSVLQVCAASSQYLQLMSILHIESR